MSLVGRFKPARESAHALALDQKCHFQLSGAHGSGITLGAGVPIDHDVIVEGPRGR